MSAAGPAQGNLAEVVALLRLAGGHEEPNEEIVGLSILDHGLQCAALLLGSHPVDLEIQVAGLVHDLGHVLQPGGEDVHGALGAAFVRPVFGQRVAALVEEHVPAKRYLVTVDSSYRARLSEGSLRTLVLQGETMSPGEALAFGASVHAECAVRLRRADDEAKDPHVTVPPLESWMETLERVAVVGR